MKKSKAITRKCQKAINDAKSYPPKNKLPYFATIEVPQNEEEVVNKMIGIDSTEVHIHEIDLISVNKYS